MLCVHCMPQHKLAYLFIDVVTCLIRFFTLPEKKNQPFSLIHKNNTMPAVFNKVAYQTIVTMVSCFWRGKYTQQGVWGAQPPRC